jgi:tetratricopeptide (TPR) repeat protein
MPKSHKSLKGQLLLDNGKLQGSFFQRSVILICQHDLEGAFGPDHPNVARDVNNLGSVYKAQGRLEEAREAYERALEIDEGAFGPDHPRVAIRVNNLGSVYQDQGRLEEAREAFERALGILERFLGPDHPSTRTVKANLESLVEEAQS